MQQFSLSYNYGIFSIKSMIAQKILLRQFFFQNLGKTPILNRNLNDFRLMNLGPVIRPIEVRQRKGEGYVHIPHPGMVRNPALILNKRSVRQAGALVCYLPYINTQNKKIM